MIVHLIIMWHLSIRRAVYVYHILYEHVCQAALLHFVSGSLLTDFQGARR